MSGRLPHIGKVLVPPTSRLGGRCCSCCSWRAHVRIRNGARWHRLWRRRSVQFCVQKSFSLLRVLIIGIELESFVHVGHGGLEVVLSLMNESAHLIIFRFLWAELDGFVVILQRLVIILQLHFRVGAPLKNVGILCFYF